jgi:tetratricopeptide (TPR) repeat protein
LPLLAAACLSVLLVALYWPAVDFRLMGVMDDPFYTNNPMVKGGLSLPSVRAALTTLPPGDNYIPVTYLSFMADTELFGSAARGFHLTNILLFAATMGSFLFVLWRMTGNLGRSCLVAALVALHPLRVESVAWVSERKDLLAVFFLVLTLGAYVRYARTGRLAAYAATVLFAALGLLSKPVLVTLPALLLLLDFWPLGRFPDAASVPDRASCRRRRLLLVAEKVPLAVLSALQAIVTIFLQSGAGAGIWTGHSLGSRIGHAFASSMAYLGQTAWPADLSFRFAASTWSLEPLTLALAVPAVVAPSILAFRYAKSFPWFAFGWFWYLAALLPVGGIMPTGFQWLSDRHTFIPHLGLMFGLVWTACESGPRSLRTGLAALLVVSLVPLALLTRRQLPYWRSGSVLLENSLGENSEDLHFLELYIGELLSEGKLDRARALLDERMEKPADPGKARFFQDRYLAVLEQQGDLDGAIALAREILGRDPRFFLVRLHLADDLLASGRVREAIPEYRQVLEVNVLDPAQRAHALKGLGFSLARRGDREEALRHLSEAARLEPEDPDVAQALADLSRNSGESVLGAPSGARR